MTGPYDDIIRLPHHTSEKHPRMGREERAAQFSPFAALAGYEDVIAETARMTEEKPVLSDDEKASLDLILSSLSADDAISLEYFSKDPVKSGGALLSVCSKVAKLDWEKRQIMLSDGLRIPVDDVISIRRLCVSP